MLMVVEIQPFKKSSFCRRHTHQLSPNIVYMLSLPPQKRSPETYGVRKGENVHYVHMPVNKVSTFQREGHSMRATFPLSTAYNTALS